MKISDTQHRLFTTALYAIALFGAVYYSGKAVVALYQRYSTPSAQADIVRYNNWTASPYTQRVYGMGVPTTRADYSMKDSRINVSVVGQNPVVPGTWGIDYGRQSTRVSNDQSAYYNPAPVYYPQSNYYSPYSYLNNTNYMPAGPLPPDYFNCFTGESIYYTDYCNSKYNGAPSNQYYQPTPVWQPTTYFSNPGYQQYYYPQQQPMQQAYGYWR